MDLLLGTGEAYSLIAKKINTNRPGELLQISPEFVGPAFEGCERYWIPFENEMDEAIFNLNSLEETSKIAFSCIYLCIPKIHYERIDLTSYLLVSMFQRYLIKYCHLIYNLIKYPCKIFVINEIEQPEKAFDLDVFCNVLRPMLLTSLKGTKSALFLYNSVMWQEYGLETFINNESNWKVD